MYEKPVSGEIMAIGWRDGSSGRFTGDILGLYEGYRWGDLEEQRGVLQVAHGSIALVVRHLHTPRGRPRGENPFAGEHGVPASSGPMPHEGMSSAAGQRPAGAGEISRGPAVIDAATAAAMAADRAGSVRQTSVLIEVDGERSTGLYAGASGEMKLTVPNLKDAGYLVVATAEGALRLDFLEWGEGNALVANLWPRGDRSTGIYHGAEGELQFTLYIDPKQGLARGPYSGVLRLAEPAEA